MKYAKTVSWLLLFCLLFSCFPFLFSCQKERAPELSEVYDRLVFLIERSQEINGIFFGAGVPVYQEGSTLATELGVYQKTLYGRSFEYARESMAPNSVDRLQQMAEEVYGIDYLKSLYTTLFHGISVEESGSFLQSGFQDGTYGLEQSTEKAKTVSSVRIYDYASMKIVQPSRATYLNVEIDSYLQADEGKESARKTVTLAFIYECDNWYLAAPSY